MPVTAFQVDIVRAIREAFDQLRFKYASADRHQYVDGRRVWVPWQEDPLEGEAGWTTAVKTTLCRVGQENFGFGVGCHGVPDSDALHPHMLLGTRAGFTWPIKAMT